MGAMFSVVKTLIVPAIISLILFLVTTYVVVPFWQRYRNRYSQYLPLDTISSGTSSLRARLQDGIGSFILPSAWRQRLHERLVVGGEAVSDGEYDSEDGEELGAVDESRRRDLESRADGIDSNRRLSRELEEGFIDDSDDEIGPTRSAR